MGVGWVGGWYVWVLLCDWRPVGAIQYPHATKMLLDGTPMMEAVVVEAKLNPELAATLFKKPAE